MILPIIMPVCQKDEKLARRLFQWWQQLGRQPAQLVLLLERRVSDLRPLVDGLFDRVRVIRDAEFDRAYGGGAGSGVSLKVGRRSFPFSPFLHTEPDAIPLHANWVERLLEAHGPDLEWTMSGALTGAEEWPDLFLNAIALYPTQYKPVPIPPGAFGSDRTNCIQYHPQLKFKTAAAFTHIYGLEHWSPLPIVNKAPSFPTTEDVDKLLAVFPETVLFHRSQDETLITRLWERAL